MAKSTGIATSIAAAGATLEAKRAAIAQVLTDVADIETASASPDDVAARVDRAIADAAARGIACHGLNHPEEGPWMEQFNASAAGRGASVGRAAVNGHPFDYFAILVPDALRSALIASAPAHGISAAERSAKLARLESELFILECEEEAICRGLDAIAGRGIEFPRRPDARPEILCAPDSELEA